MGHSQVVAAGCQALPGLWSQEAAEGWSEAAIGRLWEAAGRRLEGRAEQPRRAGRWDLALGTWPGRPRSLPPRSAELSSASLGPVRARGDGVPNWPSYGKLSNVQGRSALDLTKTLQPSRAIALRAKPGALARYRSGRGLAPAPRPPLDTPSRFPSRGFGDCGSSGLKSPSGGLQRGCFRPPSGDQHRKGLSVCTCASAVRGASSPRRARALQAGTLLPRSRQRATPANRWPSPGVALRGRGLG